MTQDELSPQKDILHKKTAIADLRAKLTNIQKDIAEQQVFMSTFFPPNQPIGGATSTAQSPAAQGTKQRIQPNPLVLTSPATPVQKTSAPAQSNPQQGYPPDPYRYFHSSSSVPNSSIPWQWEPYSPYAPVPAYSSRTGSGLAVASMVLGIISLLLWLCYGVGAITAVVGIVLSAIGWRSVSGKGMVIAGLIMSIIALMLSICLFSVLYLPRLLVSPY